LRTKKRQLARTARKIKEKDNDKDRRKQNEQKKREM
jgi:hypothetical protein